MKPVDTRRYARQLTLREIGADGQRKLAEASVVVIGAGGLGSPVLHHLVASGVGTVGIVEFDTVDISNLHRQTLYSTFDVGVDKLAASTERLQAVNPDVRIVPHAIKLTSATAVDVLAGYDLVVDGSDNFATRYVVNDAAVGVGVPIVYASVNQFSGQASLLGAPGGPCYRCLFPEPPPVGLIPSCEDGGVLGVVPSILGTIQATEALKWILQIGAPLVGRLLLVDALAMEFREVQFGRDPMCPTCGDHRRPTEVTETPEVTVRELRRRLEGPSPPALIDVREAGERRPGDLDGESIPLPTLDIREPELEAFRGRDVVVYCAAGGRSAQAVRFLRERGYKAESLRGGMAAWHASA